jgi:hypothetical protein
MKCSMFAGLLLGIASIPLSAQALPENTPVRIVASGLGDGAWLDGRVTLNKGSGCTMVVFAKKQPGGYTMVALNSIAKLQRHEKGAWVDTPVKPLLAKETKSCREAAND